MSDDNGWSQACFNGQRLSTGGAGGISAGSTGYASGGVGGGGGVVMPVWTTGCPIEQPAAPAGSRGVASYLSTPTPERFRVVGTVRAWTEDEAREAGGSDDFWVAEVGLDPSEAMPDRWAWVGPYPAPGMKAEWPKVNPHGPFVIVAIP